MTCRVGCVVVFQLHVTLRLGAGGRLIHRGGAESAETALRRDVCQWAYPGFNFFDDDDQLLFVTITRGEFNIYGFQNKHLRHYLDGIFGVGEIETARSQGRRVRQPLGFGTQPRWG